MLLRFFLDRPVGTGSVFNKVVTFNTLLTLRPAWYTDMLIQSIQYDSNR